MRTRCLLLALLALVAVPLRAQAQSVTGTLGWTHVRPADLAKYTLVIDGAPATDLGLPTTNTTVLTLTLGAHTLVLSACYVDLVCLPTTFPLTVSTPGPIQFTGLSPADAAILTLNVPLTLTVTATDDSGIVSVTLHWLKPAASGGTNCGPLVTCTNTSYTTVKNGNTYSTTLTPTSHTRAWYFTIVANDGETVNTPTRTLQ